MGSVAATANGTGPVPEICCEILGVVSTHSGDDGRGACVAAFVSVDSKSRGTHLTHTQFYLSRTPQLCLGIKLKEKNQGIFRNHNIFCR